MAELCALVKEAAVSVGGLYPIGGRTALDVGLPPIKPGIAVETTALNEVIDYPARDMTVTVRAGITLAKLQETLAAENQWLPLDVPQPESTTLGGAVALNQSGPHRHGYGTLRDYVIGISFVTDEGVEVKAGGRVVKNVAGYDLMKLQIGALGTLGVVTQVTLKVKPRPESAAAVRMLCAAGELERVLTGLHASRSRPVVVEVAADGSAVGVAWSVLVGFEEKAETVEWQVPTLLDEFRNAPVTDVTAERGTDAADRLWSLVGAADRLTGESVPRITFKANLLPSRTAWFCNQAAATYANLAVATGRFWVRAHALNGIVYGTALSDASLDEMTQAVKLLADSAAEGDGNLVLTRC